MRLASLAMYASPPPLAEATAALWRFLSAALTRAGLEDVPGTLDAAVRYKEAWTDHELLLAQTCGFPYVLRGKVRLVATPVYGHPGCDGPLKCSFIVIREDSRARSLEDLRGARAAINEPFSNSGVNLFRAAIAPLARDGWLFSSVIETGGHRNGIAAIVAGRADVAAIDCVTLRQCAAFRSAEPGGSSHPCRNDQGSGTAACHPGRCPRRGGFAAQAGAAAGDHRTIARAHPGCAGAEGFCRFIRPGL